MKFHNLFKVANNRLNTIRSKRDIVFSTGLFDLDRALGGGIAEGEVCIVAARPSHGKTSLLLNMLLSITSQGQPALLVSEEMQAEMIGERLCQIATSIPREDWRNRADDVVEDLGEFWGTRRRPLLVSEFCGDVTKVCAAIEEARDNHGIRVAAVDYLQLVRSRGTSRYEQVTNVSASLKRCATSLGVTLLVAAQLGRAFEERNDCRPRLSDLRESGQIEQDGDIIIFGYWPIQKDPRYSGDPDSGFERHNEYRIFVGKNRNRGIREPVVFVGFDAARQTFFEQPIQEAAF